ncbi:MAG: hypothetical protein E7112_04135 [Bacteroidales bacterium]|nr:hypothetical protein [Bacteroidales bacterium]
MTGDMKPDMKRLICLMAVCLIAASCGVTGTVTRGTQYAKMYEEKPVTLLVMPPINKSANVEAKDLLYTSISRPLIEAGYYVLSPLLAMDVLKSESAYDSEVFFEAPLSTFNSYFGADAVVFSVIETWAKKGLGIQTKIRYVIKSAYTDETLFDRSCDLFLDLSVDSGSETLLGALVELAAAAISTASTDHIVAARKANYYILRDIPQGKYSPQHMQDKDVAAEPKDVVARVK